MTLALVYLGGIIFTAGYILQEPPSKIDVLFSILFLVFLIAWPAFLLFSMGVTLGRIVSKIS